MRRLFQACGVAALLLTLLPSPRAGAQGREQAVLAGVNLAVVMPVDLSVNAANTECGLTEPMVVDAIQTTVQSSGLRTELLAQAEPFTTVTPGVYIVPTIAT